MKNINFICCGQTGDLIHGLYVIKKICIKENARANLYIADISYNDHIFACGNFSLDINKTLDDLKDFIFYESHINKIEILPRDFNEEYINLNLWRGAENADGWKSWTDLLNHYYNISSNEEYKYLNGGEIDERGIDKVIIHHSDKRDNNLFDWNKVLLKDFDIIFLTTNRKEYEDFPYKVSNMKLILVNTIGELSRIIKGCKLFIGNQSMPLAVASGLDVLRIGILHPNSAIFYMNEHMHSKNFSWFLSNEQKFNSINVGIKL